MSFSTVESSASAMRHLVASAQVEIECLAKLGRTRADGLRMPPALGGVLFYCKAVGVSRTRKSVLDCQTLPDVTAGDGKSQHPSTTGTAPASPPPSAAGHVPAATPSSMSALPAAIHGVVKLPAAPSVTETSAAAATKPLSSKPTPTSDAGASTSGVFPPTEWKHQMSRLLLGTEERKLSGLRWIEVTASHSARFARGLYDAGAVPVLLACLQTSPTPQSSAVQKQAACCLAALFYRHPDQEDTRIPDQAFDEHGVLPTLLGTLYASVDAVARSEIARAIGVLVHQCGAARNTLKFSDLLPLFYSLLLNDPDVAAAPALPPAGSNLSPSVMSDAKSS